MKTLLTTTTFLILLTFFSCTKPVSEPDPVANFTARTDYTVTGRISFTNVSTNAVSYSWSFGDGGSSTEANPVYTFSKNGNYKVTLTATNKSGVSKSVSSTIGINDVKGQFCIWTNTNYFGDIDIYVNGTNMGTITKYYQTIPACGSIGCVTLEGQQGNYTFSALGSNGSQWNNIGITISSGKCNTKCLVQ